MDFIDRIKELATRAPRQLEYCETEEATKNALVMPFINALGYNVFDPTEVVPEFTADVGLKKGEKADYAIMSDGQPIILFECKWSGADLNTEHASQLHRYFGAVQEVRFGVLTNGIEYRFYSDLDSLNRMDDRPFFRFNLLEYQDRDVAELKKFTKPVFDLDDILTTASELKYTAAIQKLLVKEFDSPSEDFVRFFAIQVYSGRMTQSVREQFTEITQKALKRFLNERINTRLQTALKQVEPVGQFSQTDIDEGEEDDSDVTVEKREVVTTEEEIEGYFAIKSILREHIDVHRIHIRDTKSYCGILLDDNNRKPLCRLRFNKPQLYIGLFGENKKEGRVAIDSVDEIYNYSDELIAAVDRYDKT